MVAGIILTGLSTRGVTIFENLKNVHSFNTSSVNSAYSAADTHLYAAIQFSMVVSDMTGNVKKCRALICAFYPWILNCPDPCHQLNLLAKDIIIMKTVSSITTFLSHSNYGKKHLRDKLRNEEDRCGLVSFGQTRFSTFADQSSSVTRCLLAMEQCYAKGLIKFNTKAVSVVNLLLNNINMLLKPISRSLKTLESSQVTCSDVFNIYFGITIGFKEVFADPENLILKFRQETYDVYNCRFSIFMNDCTEGMFILSYLLDPGTKFGRCFAPH
ncbi:hypothetical protein B0H10DRAFT_1779294 [Mycena sp. CBHHK59/15]|nr:hypothetical protein B0H10DRAFT_1779294 [Mycena sp. CBHHK59/15]